MFEEVIGLRLSSNNLIDLIGIVLCIIMLNPVFSIGPHFITISLMIGWFLLVSIQDRKLFPSLLVNSSIWCNFLFLLIAFLNVLTRKCSFMVHNILLLFILIFTDYYNRANPRRQFFLIKVSAVYLASIILYSMIALRSNPNMARNLAMGSEDIIRMYGNPFTAGYVQVYSIVFLFSILIGLFLHSTQIQLIGVSAIIFIFLLEAQYTAAVIAAIASIFLNIIIVNKLSRKKVVLVLFSIILVFILLINIQPFVTFVISFLPEGFMTRRLNQFAKLIAFRGVVTGDAAKRASLYDMSFRAFLDSPLFGIGNYDDSFEKYIGGHSTFIDQFASYGLFGGMLYFLIFINNFRAYMKKFKGNYKRIYFTMCVIVLTIGIINIIENIGLYFSIIFFLPGIILMSEEKRKLK